jgi:hypothetical protein
MRLIAVPSSFSKSWKVSMKSITQIGQLRSLNGWTGQLSQNPGQLYKVGNVLVIFSAVSSCVLLAGVQHLSVADSISDFFFGSLPSIVATAASFVFWTSSVKYADAWKKGFPPDQNSNAAGHALSTLGAILIGIALMAMARTEVALALAIVSTILHVGGKWGSWIAPGNDAFFKPMPFYSRIPYVTSLFLDIRADWLNSNGAAGDMSLVLLPLGLILATVVFARADWCLLQKA